MFGNPYTLFVLELRKHCGEPSPSSSQVGTHPIHGPSYLKTTPFFQCNFVECLPDFINALFEYLADEKADIHVNAERVLERFLGDVRADPSAVELNKMVNFLILHAQVSAIKSLCLLSSPIHLNFSSSFIFINLLIHNIENPHLSYFRQIMYACNLSLYTGSASSSIWAAPAA